MRDPDILSKGELCGVAVGCPRRNLTKMKGSSKEIRWYEDGGSGKIQTERNKQQKPGSSGGGLAGRMRN